MVKLFSMGSTKVCGPRAERKCNIDKDTGLQISKNLLLDYDLVCFLWYLIVFKIQELVKLLNTAIQVILEANQIIIQ